MPGAGRACPQDALRREQPDAHRVDEAVAARRPRRRPPRRRRSARRRSCRSGRCPATARSNIQSGSPKRRPSRSAIGRAPIAMMSRRIPPTPVAAPWNGSTADGWLWLSTLNATAWPSPRSSTPAFSPGPCSTRSPPRRQPLQQQRGVLVAAVLRPEQREDGQLEVVRLALEQLADTVELPVREAERAVQRLFDDPRQESENRRPDGRVRLQK